MVSSKERDIIESLSLIDDIIKYIIPSKSIKKEPKKQSKLEEKLSNEPKTNKSVNSEFLEEVLLEIKNTANIKTNKSIKIKKEKNIETKQDYSFIINYSENEREEKVRIEVEDKKKYFVEFTKPKPIPDEKPYDLDIIYENNKKEEKLEVKYNLRDYPIERELALQDFTSKVDKTLHIMPATIMGGVLGFTYLGENFMARRDDLTGDKALMVDIHEAIHTPDEYETRVLTDWILTKEKPKYKR
ncbi:MAG: hypothetical protein U9O94_06720 [Nanoarchaeota archaeon]|nr:hypothetical protein [Nanoarchaeota archaeon]